MANSSEQSHKDMCILTEIGSLQVNVLSFYFASKFEIIYNIEVIENLLTHHKPTLTIQNCLKFCIKGFFSPLKKHFKLIQEKWYYRLSQ